MNRDWYTIHRITAIKLLITFVFITFPKEKENFEASFTENHMLQLCLLEIVSFFFHRSNSSNQGHGRSSDHD